MLRTPSLREFGGPGMTKTVPRRAHDDKRVRWPSDDWAVTLSIGSLLAPVSKYRYTLLQRLRYAAQFQNSQQLIYDCPELIRDAK